MPLTGSGQPRSVCRGPRGVIVVGAGDDGSPISWLNEGDIHWHRHELSRPAEGKPEVWGVAAHGGQFVAVGSLLRPGTRATGPKADGPRLETSGRRCPVVWWTRDNTQWDGGTLDDIDDGHAQLVALSCNTDVMVAVGSTLDTDGVQGDGALALASTDGGESWRRGDVAPGDGSFSEGSFTGVTPLGDRWIATSTDIEGGAIWSSPDGLRWSTIPGSARQFRGIALHGVAAHGGRVYVAGTRLTDHRPRFMMSPDGCRTWRPVRNGPVVLAEAESTVADLTAMSGQIVVVGTRRGQPIIEGGVPDVVAD
jgi:hypothetical protein